MYSLVFNGEFQLEYPNEFLADLEKLLEKHKCDFFGKPDLQNLGTYVDFQRIEDEPKVNDSLDKEPDEKV